MLCTLFYNGVWRYKWKWNANWWNNPNIHPKVEYEKRKESFIKYCQDNGIKNVINDCYDLEGFTRDVVEQVGKDKKYNVRCKYCYYRRLEETFRYASENGYDIVSTTLTRSPFQNHDLINEVAQKLAEKYNISVGKAKLILEAYILWRSKKG